MAKPEKNDAEELLSDWHDGLEALYDAEASTPDSAQQLGKRYEDSRPLASGGQKQLVSVLDSVTGRRVALARPLASDNSSHARFLREVNLTARLRHPNVVAIHDVGIDEEGPFAVMSLIGGTSLKEADKSRSIDDKLTVLLKICDALAYAHAHGILHLDVKPANVQVGEFGDVYLLDWGLARLIQEAPTADFSESDRDLLNDLTLTGTVKGTPGFMAPEQADPNGETSKATDLYAVGALLFFLLTDAPPVQGDSLEEILSRTQLGHTGSDETLPHSLASIVRKATALDPNDRYDNVNEFRTDVERFRHGYATAAEEAGIGKQLVLLYLRNRGLCNLAAGFAAVLLIAVTIFIARLQDSRNQALLAERSAKTAQAEADSQRQQAEEALRQVLREQETGRQLEMGLRTAVDFMYDAQHDQDQLEKLSNKLTHQSTRFSSRSVYAATEIMLEQLLERDPDHFRAWRHLACLRAATLNFPGALDAFKKSADEYEFCAAMVPICQRYVDAYGDRRNLSPEEMTLIFHDQVDEGSWQWVHHHMLKYDQFRRTDIMEHARVVRNALAAYNPKVETLKFDFQITPDGNVLSLADNAGLETITFWPLGTQSSQSSQSSLETLDLIELDLRGTQLPAAELKRLPKKTRIIR